jgi:hypothetical protein
MISFDNSTNGFMANNTQAAIEEAKTSSASSIISREFSNNGTSINAWLNNAESSVPSNTAPFMVPFDCILVGVSFTNGSNEVYLDIEIGISKFNESSVIDRTLVCELRNVRTWLKSNFTGGAGLTLTAGDKIGVYIRDKGGKPNDPVVTLYFKTTAETLQTKTENHASSFSTSLHGTVIIIG